MFRGSPSRCAAHMTVLLLVIYSAERATATGGDPLTYHLYVTTTADDADAHGLDDGPLSLRGALNRAAGYWHPLPTPEHVVIHVPAGHYPLTYATQTNGFGFLRASLVLGTNLTIIGEGRDTTIIDGLHETRVIDIDAPREGQAVHISDLTIMNGRYFRGSGAKTWGNVIFERCNFLHCDNLTMPVSYDHGGAINHANGELVVRDCRFTGNKTRRFGGAIYSFSEPVLIDSCYFAGNENLTAEGGAIFSRGELTVRNSIFTDNLAGRQGGAITAYGPTTIDHCTIVNNRSNADGIGDGNGGGIRTINSISTISNSIVANNRNGAPGADSPDDISGEILSAGYNIITAVTAQTSIVGDLTGNQIGVDPLLGPLDTAEDLPFFPLRPDSPAIDAAGAGCSTYDLRGRTRPFDGDGDGIARCDIGAVEYRATPGDMNCDNAITVSDIAGFVVALAQPGMYDTTILNCERFNADVNGDGAVTVSDISDFITLLQ